MEEIAVKFLEIIREIGSSPIKLTAFVFFIISIVLLRTIRLININQRSEIISRFMIFGFIIFLASFFFDYISNSNMKQQETQVSWINWLGFLILAIGFIELVSIQWQEISRYTSYVPSLSLIFFGGSLITLSHPQGFLSITSVAIIISRLAGSFGLVILGEGLFLLPYNRNSPDSKRSILVGIVLLVFFFFLSYLIG